MSTPSPSQYVRISSADDISYTVPSTSSAGTNDAIHTIVTGRKCWKTIKGKGEVVWPPYLEAALVEGLEKYKPVESRSARALGRFPLRNKFISDYIFTVTGKRRTPKQVGSRLQQLRDTCEGKRILKLLSRRPGDPASDEDEGTPGAESRSSVSPSRECVTIDILSDHTPWPPVSASGSSLLTGPRPIRSIDNTVTFKCSTTLPPSSYSSFRVYKNGVLVTQETTQLELSQSSCMPSQWTQDVECMFLYSTRLVPQFWPRLCEAADIAAYSILQQVTRCSSSNNSTDSMSAGSSAVSSASPVEEMVFEVMYRFNTCHSPVPQSPISSNGDGASYTAESSPDLSAEYDDYSMLHPSSDLRTQSLSTLSRSSNFPSNNTIHRSYQHPSHHHASDNTFELPPGLIHAGEDGYASLPQSPLDLAFAPGLTGAGADPVDNMCASYAGCNIDYSGSAPAPACYDASGPGGLVVPAGGYGVNVNVNMGYGNPF